jgi:hypothetical protein
MYRGRIVKSGGRDFALEVDKQGYETLIQSLEGESTAGETVEA